MRRMRLVYVGELKAPWAAQACRHYQEGLSRYVRCETHVVRDAHDTRDVPARLRKEGQGILRVLDPRDRVVGLEVEGAATSSEGLAGMLGRWLDDPGRRPCFVVGGAYGFGEEARERFDHGLSLGPCTLPHELARVVLLEQLYRAMCILSGHPYHHG